MEFVKIGNAGKFHSAIYHRFLHSIVRTVSTNASSPTIENASPFLLFLALVFSHSSSPTTKFLYFLLYFSFPCQILNGTFCLTIFHNGRCAPP